MTAGQSVLAPQEPGEITEFRGRRRTDAAEAWTPGLVAQTVELKFLWLFVVVSLTFYLILGTLWRS